MAAVFDVTLDQDPPKTKIIGNETFRHVSDAPVNKADLLGAWVHVYHCRNTNDVALFDEAGRRANIPAARLAEIRDGVE